MSSPASRSRRSRATGGTAAGHRRPHASCPSMRAVCAAAGIDGSRLAGAAIAGNTTMLHLLTGTDPTSIGIAPFRAVFTGTPGDDGGRAWPRRSRRPACRSTCFPDSAATSAPTSRPAASAAECPHDGRPEPPRGLRHQRRDPPPARRAAVRHGHGCRTRLRGRPAGARAPAPWRGRSPTLSFPDGHFPPTVEAIAAEGHPRPVRHGLRRFSRAGPPHRPARAPGPSRRPAWRRAPGGAPARRLQPAAGSCLRANDPGDPGDREPTWPHLMQAKAAIAAGILILLRTCRTWPADVGRSIWRAASGCISTLRIRSHAGSCRDSLRRRSRWSATRPSAGPGSPWSTRSWTNDRGRARGGNRRTQPRAGLRGQFIDQLEPAVEGAAARPGRVISGIDAPISLAV